MIFYIRKSFVCIFCGERKREGKYFRGNCGICSECSGRITRTPRGGTFAGSAHLKYVISPLFYEDFVRDAIMRYKFESWSGCEPVFRYIAEEYLQDFPHLKEFDRVVPVPLSKARYNERGFNQSLVAAEAVSAAAGIKCDVTLLKKIRNTHRQSGLTAKERPENVRGAYIAEPSVKGKRIVLADDIYTTGVTMEECAKTLIESGAAEVVGFSLSVKYKKEKSIINRY